jgi:hypothetical protein
LDSGRGRRQRGRREAGRVGTWDEEDPESTDLGAGDESRHGGPTGPIPDIVRKALALGLAGFFTTEQTIRKALGDTLPQEWLDFVSEQSERTRGDLTEAIASEVGRSLQAIDLTNVADQLLTGRTLEVTARIRLLPPEDKDEKAEESDS